MEVLKRDEWLGDEVSILACITLHNACKHFYSIFYAWFNFSSSNYKILWSKVINYYIHLIASRSRKNGNLVYGFSTYFYALLESDGGLEKVEKSADGVSCKDHSN